MAERHRARAGQEAAAETGPERTEPPEPTLDAAAQVVREGLGPGAVKWERSFKQVRNDDGSVTWVDTQTGEMYDRLPRMHSSDGGNT
jgi:hypothetical protein